MLLVIAILVVLIVTHEFGHFIAAKAFGVRVEEFGVGYPPRALLFGKAGDTEYTLNWIPFGGFVRLYGEDDTGAHGRGSLLNAARWKQAVILAAGVFMNALVAIILFAAALYVGIPHAIQAPAPGETTHLIISEVVSGSPAEGAGLSSHDEITSIVDKNGNVASPLTP